MNCWFLGDDFSQFFRRWPTFHFHHEEGFFHVKSTQHLKTSLESFHLCQHTFHVKCWIRITANRPSSATVTYLTVFYENNYSFNIQCEFISCWETLSAFIRMPHGPVSSSYMLTEEHYLILTYFCLLADSWKSSGWSSGRNHVMFCYAQCGRPHVHQSPLLPPPPCHCHHLISWYAFPHHCPGGGNPPSPQMVQLPPDLHCSHQVGQYSVASSSKLQTTCTLSCFMTGSVYVLYLFTNPSNRSKDDVLASVLSVHYSLWRRDYSFKNSLSLFVFEKKKYSLLTKPLKTGKWLTSDTKRETGFPQFMPHQKCTRKGLPFESVWDTGRVHQYYLKSNSSQNGTCGGLSLD